MGATDRPYTRPPDGGASTGDGLGEGLGLSGPARERSEGTAVVAGSASTPADTHGFVVVVLRLCARSRLFRLASPLAENRPRRETLRPRRGKQPWLRPVRATEGDMMPLPP